jgi:hypothetical protein
MAFAPLRSRRRVESPVTVETASTPSRPPLPYMVPHTVAHSIPPPPSA